MTGIILGVVVVVFIIAWIIGAYNGLIQVRNKVKNAFAQIDTQLQRRFDLVPNLVEVVKGFATHEKTVFENIANSRSGYMNANKSADKLEANNKLTTMLKSLFAIVENYPELKANQNFIQLQADLSEIEDKITFARQFYNDAVTMYNNKLQMFPTNIIAALFGFKEEALFNTDDAVKEAPEVKF